MPIMPNNKIKYSGSLLFKILLVTLLLAANAGLTIAADEPSLLDQKQYGSFNVKNYLSVGEKSTGMTADTSTGTATDKTIFATGTTGTQDQKYLEATNPTAAFIVQVINLITLTAASLSFLAIVIAGFMLMSSAGNENQRTRGLEILQKAIVGLVITLSAYFIVAFVQNLLFETVAK